VKAAEVRGMKGYWLVNLRPSKEVKIMVDERYSSSAFEACGLDSDAARKLADLLAE